ncbi:(d)CMP kinase [Fumia xinanensis]|uniref:Cytidylate kinase n=1 Tax=Fumia xinanensis TaxID=2763659 RepID=A0A926I668_9FIRM|nr:(d)CMP kinase [Fumia xinanensis]MBC8558674.1 (d)CMP kinase [Fumia xinanensis]
MISIAIDGPSGAGKSTIAKAVSKKLGFIYVDTGALYRSIGLYVLNKGKDTANQMDVAALLPEINVQIRYVDGAQHVYLNEKDVSDDIRRPPVSMAASNVSAHPEVREFLLNLQRQFAKENNVVMDGRDIGTVVLPNADIKIFLTASSEERARRRYKELTEKGEKVEFEQIHEEIKQRDYNDSHRAIAPLKQADDAILVDTTECTLEESIDKLETVIRSRMK